MLEAGRLIPQVELLRQRRAKATGVYQVPGVNRLAVLPGDGDAVVVEVDLARPPVLPEDAAVLGGDVEIVGVAILAVQVAGPADQLGHHIDGGLTWVGLLARRVLDEAEALLLPVEG